MFDRLTQKLSSIFARYSGTMLTQASLSETIEKVKEALLEADVPVRVVETFAQEVQDSVLKQLPKNSHVLLKPSELLLKVVNEKLIEFLGGVTGGSTLTLQFPARILVMGLQGSGKTTTLAKLAHLYRSEAQSRGKVRRILLASVDVYRPAAREQLAQLAEQAGVLFYRSEQNDAVLAARDILQYAQKELVDILLLDTAGRFHIDATLIDELKALDRLVKPTKKLLVLDSMIGQESLVVAQTFYTAVPYDGAILTKMDSDTRGGVALAFSYIVNKPVFFVGSGEKLDDLEPFRPDRMASRIMGQGDIQTLLEQAQKKIKHSEQQAAANAFTRGTFTLDDFAAQLSMMNKLGSLATLAQYLPGMGSVTLTPQMMEQGEKDMKKFRAILSSMTPKERRFPKILNGDRKKRIAQGAGVTPADVNSLLARFEQTHQFATLFKKVGKKQFSQKH